MAREFSLPFISRDDIKELLFDSLGWKDREWSKKLGLASYSLLYHFLEFELCTGRSLIVESNFKAEFDTKKFLGLREKYDFEPFQIQCKVDSNTLFERFKRRSESGERHPGHVDHLSYEEFKSSLLKDHYEILDIGGRFFEVDTTDFDTIDYEGLFKAIRSAINNV